LNFKVPAQPTFGPPLPNTAPIVAVPLPGKVPDYAPTETQRGGFKAMVIEKIEVGASVKLIS
jgi:hypothetical protein